MTQSPPRHTLSIVIPAFNEEEAIGGTIARCLEAVEPIRRAADLDAVEIIVVSDGSTDRTAEIARSFSCVKVIEFEQNRGYGVAIQEGFHQARGSLLSFLDADGTCDPLWFGEMCRVAATEDADLVLGSRLGPDSRMPPVRKFGNRLFAILLGLLCGRPVTDTASGMRVLQRAALDDLGPLPGGLHFTPSMSARALLGGMRVVEVPMPYHERIGRSKLRLLSDGIRFLRVILSDVLCYRPERLFLLGCLACFLVAAILGAYPAEFYLRNRSVEDWMIYRFLVCGLLGSAGFQLLAAAAITYRMAAFGPRRRPQESFWLAALVWFFGGWAVLAFAGLVTILCVVLLWPGMVEYVRSAEVHLHWSRFVTAVFGLLVVSQSLVAAVLLRVVNLWKSQLSCRAEASR